MAGQQWLALGSGAGSGPITAQMRNEHYANKNNLDPCAGVGSCLEHLCARDTNQQFTLPHPDGHATRDTPISLK